MAREYALMNKNKTVVLNMCQTQNPTGPTLNDYQLSKGYIWVPLSEVSTFALQQYRYWSERP